MEGTRQEPGLTEDLEAVADAEDRAALGYTNVSAVRIGKSIRLVIDAGSEAAARAQVEEMCERILANPVIEAYTIDLQVLADA